MSDKRDWQADRELAIKVRFEYDIKYLNEVLDALIYWGDKAAAEKERTDKEFEIGLKTWKRAMESERREWKLKEALEHCINQYPQWDSKEIAGTLMIQYMENVLSTLYPKEATE